MSNTDAITEQQLKDRLKLMYPSEEDKLDCIMTMLGMSATLTKFLMDALKPRDINELPVEVNYACAITSSNMVGLLSPSEDPEFQRIKFPTHIMVNNEQREETVRRRLIEVIESMYEWIHEDKNNAQTL